MRSVYKRLRGEGMQEVSEDKTIGTYLLGPVPQIKVIAGGKMPFGYFS